MESAVVAELGSHTGKAGLLRNEAGHFETAIAPEPLAPRLITGRGRKVWLS